MLSENSKRYCGILQYFGSASYLYQKMPMGLNISPSIWQSYINAILDCLQNRKYCEAIMDDLLLFTPSKKSHMDKSEDILKALLKNRLKISANKCQLFRTNLQYMGNEIFIKKKSMCATLEKQVGSYTKATTTFNGKRLQKLCRNGKLFEYVLPRITETVKTYIQPNHERKAINLGKRTTRFF